MVVAISTLRKTNGRSMIINGRSNSSGYSGVLKIKTGHRRADWCHPDAGFCADFTAEPGLGECAMQTSPRRRELHPQAYAVGVSLGSFGARIQSSRPADEPSVTPATY